MHTTNTTTRDRLLARLPDQESPLAKYLRSVADLDADAINDGYDQYRSPVALSEAECLWIADVLERNERRQGYTSSVSVRRYRRLGTPDTLAYRGDDYALRDGARMVAVVLTHIDGPQESAPSVRLPLFESLVAGLADD